MKNRHDFFSNSLCALVFTLLISFNANSQGPHASDVDLKAAYCIPFINDAEDGINKIREKYPLPGLNIDSELKNIQDSGSVFNNKLRSYLRARNQSHNIDARNEVLAAISAGEKALNVMKKIKDTCSSKLDFKNLSTDQVREKIQSCWKANGSDMLKLEICNDLNFLPY